MNKKPDKPASIHGDSLSNNQAGSQKRTGPKRIVNFVIFRQSNPFNNCKPKLGMQNQRSQSHGVLYQTKSQCNPHLLFKLSSGYRKTILLVSNPVKKILGTDLLNHALACKFCMENLVSIANESWHSFLV